MRFLEKPAVEQYGRTRPRRGFLIFPKKIDKETRWLEFARWEDSRSYRPGGWDDGSWYWESTRWVNP